MNPAPLWTEERVALLKARWWDGATADAIAAELGGVTRSAICGKVHREGFTKRERWKPLGRKARIRNERPRNPPTPTRSLALLALFGEASEATELPAEGVPATAVTFAELEAGMCKWPFGETGTPEFRFCGGDRFERWSYCAGHCRMAYAPAKYHAPRVGGLSVRIFKPLTTADQDEVLA